MKLKAAEAKKALIKNYKLLIKIISYFITTVKVSLEIGPDKLKLRQMLRVKAGEM